MNKKIYAALMKLGAAAGCHQRKDRSFFYKGYQFPVCSRCTGVAAGQLLGILSIAFFSAILELVRLFLLYNVSGLVFTENENQRIYQFTPLYNGSAVWICLRAIICGYNFARNRMD